MCDFISWIEFEDDIYYLDNIALETKEGRALLKWYKDNRSMGDICGHGAIRKYYPELKNWGTEKECGNFSTPDNFPVEIVNKIKKGLFSKIRFRDTPIQLLNEFGQIEYKKIEQSARAEYEKIEQSAWAEYEKIEQSAWAEYKKIQQPAWIEYKKIQQSAWIEYKKIQQSQQSKFWEIFKQLEYRNPLWV